MIEKPEKIDGFDKYEVERAADVLIQAEEVRLDPKLFKAAAKLVARKRLAAAAVKLKATQAAIKKISG